MFFVEPCPVCGLCYTYNNICISSCMCTYHHFNVGVLLENGSTSCVKAICGKMLKFAWFKSTRFKHNIIQLKRAKLERGYNVVTRLAKGVPLEVICNLQHPHIVSCFSLY
jgi:hypothetical protein